MVIPKAEDSVSLCLFNLMTLPHFLGTEAVILVPSAQSLKIKNLAGEGVRVDRTFPSGTAFFLSGFQNVPYQRYGIVLLAFQPQRPSFPFSPLSFISLVNSDFQSKMIRSVVVG